MKKGSKRSPIQPPTKEELEREMKRAEARTLIKEKFYPAMVEATESVDEATHLMNAVTGLIMEEAMETLRTMHMKEIKNRIVKKLCPNDERLLQIENLIGVFDAMTLYEARGHFESMRAVLQQIQLDEMRTRKLNTFTVDWNRYLQ